MPRPYISIIVPIYNVEQYLDRCVKSILDQTLKNIEIILVDDESPDNCPLMCDEYSKADNRVKVIHKKNQGLGFARNSGLEISTGEYVYFIDSDDYINRDACEKLYLEAKKGNLDVCFAGVILEDANGTRTYDVPFYKEITFTQPEIIENVLAGMLGLAPNGRDSQQIRMSAWQGIYRREMIETNNIKFPSEREFISEDIIYQIDTLQKAKSLKYIKECLYVHLIDNPTSLTHKYNPERFNKCTMLYLEEVRRTSSFCSATKMQQRAQEMYLGNVRLCIKQLVAQEKTLGKSFVKGKISEITNNTELQNVLKTYPIWENPIKRAIFSYLLKIRCVFLVYYFAKIGLKLA